MTLVDVIARIVPVMTLAEIVADLGLLPDFDLHRKAASGAPEDVRKELAARVVASAQAQGRQPALARKLYRRIWGEPGSAELVPYMDDPAEANVALQAAMVKRANTMWLPNLRRFLAQCEQHVCVIAARLQGEATRYGTGFLVGPNLVLTAYHTLARHIDGGRARDPLPGELCALFDFHDGQSLIDVAAPAEGTRRIDFAADWLVASCQTMPNDGEIEDPDADQIQKLKQNLDFALVRLHDPVGREARRRDTGGAPRSWLPLDRPRAQLQQDHRIIIPQHPGGYPQRVDFGRFSQLATALDTSVTRLRYSTETADGTSGAPCFSPFDDTFTLVGMHNAAFRRNGEVIANQAVRLECIIDALQTRGTQLEAPLSVDKSVWSAAANREAPAAILGRKTLIEWIAAAPAANTRKGRVYAATCDARDPGQTRDFGKTFSIDILRAALRDRSATVVVVGTEAELLPATAPDVLRSIADQLSIPSAVFKTMPTRPTVEQVVGERSEDKLSAWASMKLPKWFAEVLRNHRTERIDRVAKARETKRALEQLHIAVPLEIEALACSAAPDLVESRWEQVWIAVDRIADDRETTISAEVRDLFAGMTGGKLAEVVVDEELRRLRWLFLGWGPDTIDMTEVTQEVLDPTRVDIKEIIDVVRAFAIAYGTDLDDGTRVWLTGLWNAVRDELQPGDATKWLRKLQRVLGRWLPNIQERIRAAA